jgi:hypothetical protein
MFLDNALSFNSSWSTPSAAITATADGTTVIDITGAGAGNAPAMINGYPAANTAIGEDYGAGDGIAIPRALIIVNTTGTGTGTVTFTISAAPDNGSYSAGTYYDLVTTPAYVATNLIAGTVIELPLPPIPEGLGTEKALPRFYKITYTVASTVGAVKFISGLTINPFSRLLGGRYNNNFLVV